VEPTAATEVALELLAVVFLLHVDEADPTEVDAAEAEALPAPAGSDQEDPLDTFSKRFQAGSVPRDSMRATKLSRGKAAMGPETEVPPPFPGGVESGGVTAAVAKTSDTMNGRGIKKPIPAVQ